MSHIRTLRTEARALVEVDRDEREGTCAARVKAIVELNFEATAAGMTAVRA